MATTNPTRSFLLFAIVAAAGGVVAFLLASGFTASWDGRVVSVANGLDGPTVQVLIADETRNTWVETWPTEAVRGHSLRIDPRGVVPAPLPDDLPRTRKAPFQLHFFVQNPEGTSVLYPTTSIRSLSVGVLVFVLLIAARNMLVSGSPMRIEPRPTVLPAPQTPAGQVAPPKRARPKKGPPPPRPRKRPR